MATPSGSIFIINPIYSLVDTFQEHRYRGKGEAEKFVRSMKSGAKDTSLIQLQTNLLGRTFLLDLVSINSYITSIQKYRFQIDWRTRDARK